MKRRTQSPAQVLLEHLSAIKGGLLRVQEDLHHLFIASMQHQKQNDETRLVCDAESVVQQSSNHLLRCCLHMYNALEDGLDYTDSPATTRPEVLFALCFSLILFHLFLTLFFLLED